MLKRYPSSLAFLLFLCSFLPFPYIVNNASLSPFSSISAPLCCSFPFYSLSQTMPPSPSHLPLPFPPPSLSLPSPSPLSSPFPLPSHFASPKLNGMECYLVAFRHCRMFSIFIRKKGNGNYITKPIEWRNKIHNERSRCSNGKNSGRKRLAGRRMHQPSQGRSPNLGTRPKIPLRGGTSKFPKKVCFFSEKSANNIQKKKQSGSFKHNPHSKIVKLSWKRRSIPSRRI